MYPGILLNYTQSRLHRGGHVAADVHANSIAAQRFNRFPIQSRDRAVAATRVVVVVVVHPGSREPRYKLSCPPPPPSY